MSRFTYNFSPKNVNQSRNLRTSDKPHWLRKLLRMAKGCNYLMSFNKTKPGGSYSTESLGYDDLEW